MEIFRAIFKGKYKRRVETTGRAKRSQDIKSRPFFCYLSLPFWGFDYYGAHLVPPLRREFRRI